MSDKLELMWDMQRALNERIGIRPDDMAPTEQIQWILNYCRAMSQEIAELTDSVPWKWWAHYQTYNKENARKEVVDLFHFLISVAQVLGMSAKDVYQEYCKKHKVNIRRQETGYRTKDEYNS